MYYSVEQIHLHQQCSELENQYREYLKEHPPHHIKRQLKEWEDRPKRRRGRPPKNAKKETELIERVEIKEETEKVDETFTLDKQDKTVQVKQEKPKRRSRLKKKLACEKQLLINEEVIEITEHTQFYNEFHLKPKADLTDFMKSFIKSESFQLLFCPSEDMDSSLNSYLRHYFRGVPRDLLNKRGVFSNKILFDTDNENALDFDKVMDKLNHCMNNGRSLFTVVYSLISISLFSVYPPNVCVTNCYENHFLIARSQIVDMRKLCELCIMLATLLQELNYLGKDKQKGDNDNDWCLCGECVKKTVGGLSCSQCHKQYHHSCLGLYKTEYSDMVQTKFWGYWTLERGFLCPFCCRSELFETSHMMKGVVQIKDSVAHSWQVTSVRKQRNHS